MITTSAPAEPRLVRSDFHASLRRRQKAERKASLQFRSTSTQQWLDDVPRCAIYSCGNLSVKSSGGLCVLPFRKQASPPRQTSIGAARAGDIYACRPRSAVRRLDDGLSTARREPGIVIRARPNLLGKFAASGVKRQIRTTRFFG